MAERTIKHVSFSYFVKTPDPLNEDKIILAEKFAARGETVDIPLDSDLERGEKFGAFMTEEDEPEEGVEEVDSISNLSDEELVEWIRNDRPTVNEVVDAAEGDPALAIRLLDAEDAATDGDSRKGVVESLGHIIARG